MDMTGGNFMLITSGSLRGLSELQSSTDQFLICGQCLILHPFIYNLNHIMSLKFC